jgi:V8-like Glu-specific endopeptidase
MSPTRHVQQTISIVTDSLIRRLAGCPRPRTRAETNALTVAFGPALGKFRKTAAFEKETMNILDAVQQTTRRAGGRHTRRRGTEAFKRATRDWRTVERPERVLRRMEELGLHQEASTLASSMSSGKNLIGFNPLERIIGKNQLMSSFFLTLGAERARAVGRIVTRTGVGIGTGFLISPRLLMTNNHVIESDRVAARCCIEFDFVRRFDIGFGATQLFRLLPSEFFLTSVTRDDLNLDYTIVAVESINSQGEELAARGSIPLVSSSGDLTVLEWANIIQHPGGDPQQVALRDNKVVKSLEHFIHYEADTQPGSSGSPVFNDQWQLVALHHSGVPDQERPGVYRLRNGDKWDSRRPLPYQEQLRMWAKVNWLANEGVRLNSIIADVRSRLGDDATRHALFYEALRENASPAAGVVAHADADVERVGELLQPTEGLELNELREPMEVICHVSPDDGWPVLNDFLDRVESSLTIGISDLSAPHVVRKLKELARERPAFRLNLVQREPARRSVGSQDEDLGEAEVVDGLREVMGSCFRHTYVSVPGDTRTFADSYHIKVAVRDGEELWLSSGNMQSSSQPPPEVRPAATGEQSVRPLIRYNREWHVIIKNERLARLFESSLLHDLGTAEANPATPLLPINEPLIQLERLTPDQDLVEESARARYFAHKVIQRDEGAPVTVRPLLTPGNYLEHVIRLVHSARSTLFIQNQSLTLLDPLDKNEDTFVELWRAVRSRQEAGVDVRMIFGDCDDEDWARAVKGRLVKFGFKPRCIRAQRGCHTKGLIVDSQTVLVGSHHWTNQGVTANPDASLIFRHPEIARYYERIFLFDWKLLAREPDPPSPPREK